MEKLNHKKAARVFAGAFSESLAEAVAQAAGQAWPLGIIDSSNLPTRNGQPAHFRISVDGDLSGECFIEFYEPQLSDVCAKILDQPSRPLTMSTPTCFCVSLSRHAVAQRLSLRRIR